MDTEPIHPNDHFGIVTGHLRALLDGRPLRMPFCSVRRFRTGRIVEHWEAPATNRHSASSSPAAHMACQARHRPPLVNWYEEPAGLHKRPICTSLPEKA
jgi:hypothetical protein